MWSSKTFRRISFRFRKLEQRRCVDFFSSKSQTTSTEGQNSLVASLDYTLALKQQTADQPLDLQILLNLGSHCFFVYICEKTSGIPRSNNRDLFHTESCFRSKTRRGEQIKDSHYHRLDGKRSLRLHTDSLENLRWLVLIQAAKFRGRS